MTPLTDRFGRTFPYLRLSVIDACNFRCSYCLPDGYRAAHGRAKHLELDEIARLLRAFARAGMRKVRITGGEPSLRRDLTAIIGVGATTPGVETVALTTNGSVLPQRIDEWIDAGLRALNVSVDTLDAHAFARITGHDRLGEILQGVERARARRLPSIKLNAVLLRGLNDDQLPTWLDYLRDRDVGVRFIELMQTGDNRAYFEKHHLRAETLEAQLVDAGWSLRPRAPDAGPAREYVHPEYAGRIGIIAPYSRDFCAGCNRLRVTSTGDLRLCLFGDFGIALRPLLQRDDQAEELLAVLVSQLGLKKATHGLHEGNTGITPHLASIGG
ncbi:GTP 3',8-cyclase MoaA [Cognatilysobacter bugurensis]|uniref:GTP 3',8-cyclase n=1 Tax=Cognatilysobacter bugurensis TaxID=543356 RepID=A0A918SWY3_9GAMM|nr:GTP 3',8-cyclase MoaA [Lysobacter bugurensis]GHA73070.1 GTP 3',8-cyclase [Lysobacter bugurensis]